MLQNLILRTRLCGTGLITQPGWLFNFHPTKTIGSKSFVPLRYHVKGHIGGAGH